MNYTFLSRITKQNSLSHLHFLCDQPTKQSKYIKYLSRNTAEKFDFSYKSRIQDFNIPDSKTRNESKRFTGGS